MNREEQILRHINWETYNRDELRQLFQNLDEQLLLKYSEWLDQQGLVVGDGVTMVSIAQRATRQDKRTHTELVQEFLAAREATMEIPKLAPHGGCHWKGCPECFPRTYKEFLADQRLAKAERDGIEDSWYE